MASMAPEGQVYQAGTLSGNPLAVAAGNAMLDELSRPDVYGQLDERSAQLSDGLEEAANLAGVSTFHTRVGSMQCMFFTDGGVNDYGSATSADTERYAAYFTGMLERGSYFAPSQFEAAFVSTAHSEEDLGQTVEHAREVFSNL